VGNPNWVDCARALVAHGLVKAKCDSSDSEAVRIGGQSMRLSDDTAEVLLNGSGTPSEAA